MLTLLGARAKSAVGLDLSQQMLNIARTNVARAGLKPCELRHGDIFATRPAAGEADLVVVHQVLHYLGEPAAAVAEAARLVAPGGKLLDRRLRAARPGVPAQPSTSIAASASSTTRSSAGWRPPGSSPRRRSALPPERGGLTVKIWTGCAGGRAPGRRGDRNRSRQGGAHEPVRRAQSLLSPLGPVARAGGRADREVRVSFEFSPPKTPESEDDAVDRHPPARAARTRPSSR